MFILYFYAFILGTCIGSFSNVCVFRWLKNESVVFKPSHCLTCGNKIKWYDNIPIISYLILKGKCRNCHTHISIQYPIIEFLSGLIFLLIFYKFGISILCLKYMFISWMFIVATTTDIKERIIPNEVSIVGILSIIVFFFIDNTMNISSVLLGFLFPSIILLLISVFLEYLTGIDTIIGGGDIKFLFAVGGLMGPLVSTTILLLGCVFLSIIYFPALIKDYKNKTKTYCPMMLGFMFSWIVIINYGVEWIYNIIVY